MNKSTKIVSVAILWITYAIIIRFLYPYQIVDSTLQQMSNEALTQQSLELSELLWKISFLVPLIITIYIFLDEIYEFIYSIFK